jgi:hypothetical protein
MRQSQMKDEDRLGEIDDLLGELDAGDGAASMRMVSLPARPPACHAMDATG